MISIEDKNILQDIGKKLILDSVLDSKILKNKLTFKEHVNLCKFVESLSYEDVIKLTITESIKDFESKFRKFLKYGFAALAGLASPMLIGGPPVAMFGLYLFRKLTDTCSRSCLTKILSSTKRKICRYECQVNAARKVVNDIRSEMSKCRNFARPEKCEKSLRKEFIKWNKRLQVQIVKLNQSKLGVEEKLRKQKQKELAKRARHLAASYNIPKSLLLKIVTEDKQFRQKIPFRDHLKIYQAVNFIEEQENEVGVKAPHIDPKKEKMVRQALYLGLWIIPVPFFNDVVNYIIKKYNFICIGKCIKNKQVSKKLCRAQCSYLSAKYGVSMLNKQLAKCNKAKNPVKCKKAIYKMLQDWKQREVETKIKYQARVKNEKAGIK